MRTIYSDADPTKYQPEAPLLVDRATGGLKVSGLSIDGDVTVNALSNEQLRAAPISVLERLEQNSNAPSSFTQLTTAGDIAIPAGKRLCVRNQNTVPLRIKLGSGASAVSYNETLVAGAAVDDGNGGAIDIQDHIGVVSFYGASYRYRAWLK